MLARSELGFIASIGMLLCTTVALPAQAQSCKPLNVVGGEGTSVKKTVSPLGTLVTNDNWNTDFAVPGGQVFTRYVATIVPENDAQYDVKFNLKYSNNTSDKFYDKENLPLKVRKAFTVSGEPRSATEPYQINVFIGGLEAIGNTYTVSVAGCR